MKQTFFIINKKKLFFVLSLSLIIVLALSLLVPLCMKATLVSASLKKCPIYRVDTNEKKVAITVNAAWEDTDTTAFLDIFDRYNIKATFFVVGEFAQRCENSVSRIHSKGHEIGTHSDTHADMAKLDETAIKNELIRSSDKIKRITGKAPTLFRPPSGSYNNTVITTAEELGYTCIQWDTDTVDWQGKTAEEMLEKVKKKTKHGSIILLHLGAENTKQALPQIIEYLLFEGYTITPVSELIYPPDTAFTDSLGEQHLKK